MKRSLCIAGVWVIATIVFFSFYRPMPDPVWNGRKISEWTRDLTSANPEIEARARINLLQIKEPAAPHLAKLLRQRDTAIPEKLQSLANRTPFFRQNSAVSPQARDRALELLAELGPAAAAALSDVVALLGDSADGVVQQTEHLLRTIGPASGPALAMALRNNSKTIRVRAARCLRDFPSDATIQALALALQDDFFFEVRAASAESLGRLRATNSVNALLASLEDLNFRVRASAAEALGIIGEKSAVPKLLQLRRDNFPEVQLQAAKAIWKIDANSEAILPTLISLLQTEQSWQAAYVLAEMRREAAPAIPALVASMRREQVPRPFRAVSSATFALGQIGEPAIPALIQALQDKQPVHRANAAMALGFMQHAAAPATSALLAAVEDSNGNVRQAAALTLGRIGCKDERTIRGLSQCLRADDIFVRSQAHGLLQQLAPEQEWLVSLSD
jgi:HEAT repeat protein